MFPYWSTASDGIIQSHLFKTKTASTSLIPREAKNFCSGRIMPRQLWFWTICQLDKGLGIYLVIKAAQKRVATDDITNS